MMEEKVPIYPVVDDPMDDPMDDLGPLLKADANATLKAISYYPELSDLGEKCRSGDHGNDGDYFCFQIGKERPFTRFPNLKAFLVKRSTALCQMVKNSPNQSCSEPFDFDKDIFGVFYEYLYRKEGAGIEWVRNRSKGWKDKNFIQFIELALRFCERTEIDGIYDGLITIHSASKLQIVATKMNLPELGTKSCEFINKNAFYFVKTEEFLELDSDSLKRILESDDLCSDEIRLFNAVLSWTKKAAAKTLGAAAAAAALKEKETPTKIQKGRRPKKRKRKQASKQEQEESKKRAENIELVPSPGLSLWEEFKDVFSLIRFPLISPSDMADVVRPQNLLPDDVYTDLLTYCCSRTKDYDLLIRGFSSKPRKNVQENATIGESEVVPIKIEANAEEEMNTDLENQMEIEDIVKVEEILDIEEPENVDLGESVDHEADVAKEEENHDPGPSPLLSFPHQCPSRGPLPEPTLASSWLDFMAGVKRQRKDEDTFMGRKKRCPNLERGTGEAIMPTPDTGGIVSAWPYPDRNIFFQSMGVVNQEEKEREAAAEAAADETEAAAIAAAIAESEGQDQDQEGTSASEYALLLEKLDTLSRLGFTDEDKDTQHLLMWESELDRMVNFLLGENNQLPQQQGSAAAVPPSNSIAPSPAVATSSSASTSGSGTATATEK